MANSSTTGLKLDQISLCTMPIKPWNLETKTSLAVATGFTYKHSGRYYLITNWHNVTGFDGAGKRIDRKGLSSPTGLEISPSHKAGESSDLTWMARKTGVCGLYDRDKKPKWYIHPTLGQRVDVVALEMEKRFITSSTKCINDIEFDDGIAIEVADDVVVIGHPHGYSSGKRLPIWKKGSVASEPDMDFDGLPLMLVDIASRPGMSGSPVICRRIGIHNLRNGSMVDDSLIGRIQNFCGVYSGRLKSKQADFCTQNCKERMCPDCDENYSLDTQLGMVWRSEVIEQIIEGECQDTEYYPDKPEAQTPP